MKNLIFSFEEMGQQKDRATKKVIQFFSRAGAPVVQGDVSPTTRRTAGVSYKEMALTFADGQTVVLRVKQTGDIFQVLINGKVQPIKNQDDHAKAIAEIVKVLDAGRAKFQASLAKAKAALPKGIKSAAPKIEAALKQKATDLDAAIVEARTKVDELRKELGDETVTDSAVIPPVALNGFDSNGGAPANEVNPQLAAAAAAHLEGGDVSTLDSADAEIVKNAVALAEQYAPGAVLDSVDLSLARSALEIALDTVETNYPINLAAGNVDQAELEKANAESFRAAIAILDRQAAALDDVKGDEDEDDAAGDVPEEQKPLFDEVAEPA